MSTKARSLILDPGAHKDEEPRPRAKGEGDGLLPVVPRAGAEPAAQPLPRASAVPRVAREGPGAASLPELRAWPQMPPHTHPAALGAR